MLSILEFKQVTSAFVWPALLFVEKNLRSHELRLIVRYYFYYFNLLIVACNFYFHVYLVNGWCVALPAFTNLIEKMMMMIYFLHTARRQKSDRFNLFTFFRADLIQSEASWKLSSTSDWLMTAWKNVNKNGVLTICRYLKRFYTYKKINNLFLKFDHSLLRMSKS